MGKGSKQRPIEDKEAFDDNWDKIFGGRREPEPKEQNNERQKPTPS